ILTNTFVLGYAIQKGLVPLSLQAIEQAFRLNGVQVDQNLNALNAGRLAAVGRLELPEAEDDSGPDVTTLDGLLAHRAAHLTRYQNAAYARTFLDFVADIRNRAQAASGRGDDIA